MRRARGYERCAWLALLAWLGCFLSAGAHEPIFGLGPHTVGKYGWAVENALEGEGDRRVHHLELLYGLDADVAVTLVLPYWFAAGGRTAGVGDVVLRGKYRFLRRDFPGGSRAFALHLGVKLASGNRREGRGTGTVDAFAGLSFGLESRRHYSFAAVRYRWNGSRGGLNRGDRVNLEAAYGVRPWLLAYHQPDLVVLVEALLEHQFPDRLNGTRVAGSGETVFSLAPGFPFSIRNVMLKGGLKLPVAHSRPQEAHGPDRVWVLSVDIHMPPFK